MDLSLTSFKDLITKIYSMLCVSAIMTWSRFPKPRSHLSCCNIANNKGDNHWMNFGCQWSWNEKWRCMSGVVHMKGIYNLNHWREIICFIPEMGLQIRPSSAILGPNSKSSLGFYPKNDWLPASLCSYFTHIWFLKVGIFEWGMKNWQVPLLNNLFTRFRLIYNDLM